MPLSSFRSLSSFEKTKGTKGTERTKEFRISLCRRAMGYVERQPFAAGVGQAAKKLDIQARGAGGGRIPLHAEGKPILVFGLDTFHHAIQSVGADQNAAGRLVDGGGLLAVDHNRALAIEIRQWSAGHDRDRVPQP